MNIQKTTSISDFWSYVTLECSRCFEEIGSVAFNPHIDGQGDLISQESVLCPKCYDKVFPY